MSSTNQLRDSELSLQGECYQLAYNRFREVRGLLHHIPNGGLRTKQEAAQLKASGVVEGVCDLFLPMGRRGCAGLYIEMKLPGKNLRDTQFEFVEKVKKENYVCFRIDSVLNFIHLFEWYLGYREDEPILDKL